MEFGPRALGSRSILGDPRDETMQSKLNLKIKFRESFRPFAPTVLREDVDEYFDSSHESPYMLLIAKVRPHRCLRPRGEADLIKRVNQKRSDIPAVTHVDYSARIQTIDPRYHRDYYNIVRQFKELTGCSVLVNTSFNVRDEPIVCQPYDAVRCFMNTGMDILAIEDFIVYKSDQDPLLLKEDTVETYLKEDTAESKNDRRIEKASKKLFSKHLLKTKREIEETPIDLSFDHNSAQSNWRNNRNTHYHWQFKVNGLNRTEEVEFILSFWDHFDPNDRELFKPLLNSLIKLEKSVDVDRASAHARVNEEMYAMF